MQRGPRPRHIPIDQLFWSIVNPVLGDDRCWEWPNSLKNKDGKWPYGEFTLDGEQIPAHRAAWILTYGPIPAGKLILHRCDFTPCVRPSHLFLGSPLDNMRDMIAKGRNKPIQRAMKNGRWAVRYDACTRCDTTTVEHKAKGLCVDCYSLARPPKTKRITKRRLKEQGLSQWAKGYDACVLCHTTKYECVSYGRCKRCYERKNNQLPT
jgi:hypothetical protein